ncbi:molybdate ABC transporter substrate-binding protein [Curtobacterium flaccumfaciens]|uniref:Molybdate ABC transporter substrate-binding protein n=1 Tax=Curtobacterium poinsettiae TaxID=159612 RepID=A0A9Q9T2R4_9MICO|nr:molybdate ABC transporter substrate-binding protein [Curtobacterium flaccumfaciens]UXN25855.1 molybdate ABC transporter substrate-binding protein [Curtobacterium flaccumfaciens]UYC80694.1 molybdate ABC transporter substrate-binding protein [Curtobacterium flaccumfaciens pv. poinsettiae]
MIRRSRSLLVPFAVVATLGLSACSTADAPVGSSSPSSSSSADTEVSGSITVFAAASLQQTFTTLGKQFETANPGASIRFSFAGSSDLVTQIQNGAPADVFASADEANMAKLSSTDLASGSPRDFATNVLEIAVAPGNPKGITDLDDLTAPGVQLVTCAAPVPCGAATAEVESASGVDLEPVSEEQSVTDVLGKVESGQADAGLVYVTDVRGAGGKVDGVPFDESGTAVNTYPIGVLRDSEDPALAQAFSEYVRSAAGQRVLADAGFGKP